MTIAWSVPAALVVAAVAGCVATGATPVSSTDAAGDQGVPADTSLPREPDGARLDGPDTGTASDGLLTPDAVAEEAGAPDGSSTGDAQVYGPDGAACFLEGYRVCCGLPGEFVGGTCYPRQSVEQNLAHCVAEGGAFDLKDRSLGVHCCPGLVGASPATPLPGGQACSQPPISLAVCLPCGDGVCQPSENRCSCPSECR